MGTVFYYDSQLFAPGGRKFTFPQVTDINGGQQNTWNMFGHITVVWSGTRQLVASCGVEHVQSGTPEGGRRVPPVRLVGDAE